MGDRLTAAQAAARLGVRTETLYAYVSRGLIARERGAHGSTFDVLDVEAFARRRRRATGPSHGAARAAGSDGSPLGVIDTDIALIEDGELWLRGVPVDVLAAADDGGGRFDAVVTWLFARSPAPDPRTRPLPVPPGAAAARATVAALPGGAPAFSRLLAAVAALSAVDPERYDPGPEAVARIAARLIAGMVDALPVRGADPGGEVPLAARLWARLTAVPAQDARVAVLDAALVTLVDHDMAVSTLAARAAASARAHPYAVVAAGLGALDSALHGAVSGTAQRMLQEVRDGADPAAAVAAASRAGRAGIPGFGQPSYPAGDPRAAVVLGRMRVSGDNAARDAVRVADAVGAVVEQRTGLRPTVDLALATMALAWDMPYDAGETVFAVSRAAGWCAHALDEYSRPPLRLRPLGRYTGPDPADVQHSVSNAR